MSELVMFLFCLLSPLAPLAASAGAALLPQLVQWMPLLLLGTALPPSAPKHRDARGPPDALDDAQRVTTKEVLYWVFNIPAYFLVIGLSYAYGNEAVRMMIASTKLDKLPMLGSIFRLIGNGKLDTASLAAFLSAIVAAFALKELAKVSLVADMEREFDLDVYRALLWPFCIGTVLAESSLTYLGMVTMNYGRVTFSLPAMLLTLILFSVQLAVALVSLKIKKSIQNEKENR